MTAQLLLGPDVVTAMRVVRLLVDAAATGESIDRSGGGRFVEVYPAASFRVWGFPSRSYKGGGRLDRPTATPKPRSAG